MFNTAPVVLTSDEKEAEKRWRTLVGNTIGHPLPELVSRRDLAHGVSSLRGLGEHGAARALLQYKTSCAGK